MPQTFRTVGWRTQRAMESFILELQSLSLVIQSGDNFHPRASNMTRRPLADTRGRCFNVLQPGIHEGGHRCRGGLGIQFSVNLGAI